MNFIKTVFISVTKLNFCTDTASEASKNVRVPALKSTGYNSVVGEFFREILSYFPIPGGSLLCPFFLLFALLFSSKFCSSS